MRVLGSYKANRAVQVLLTAAERSEAEVQQAGQRLRQLGPAAVPRLLAALPMAHDPVPIEHLLATLVDSRTLARIVEALVSAPDRRTATSIGRVLEQARGYDPNQLVEAIVSGSGHQGTLVSAALAHKDRIDPQRLLAHMSRASATARGALLKLLDAVATQELVPDIDASSRQWDPVSRARVAEIYSRFSSDAARKALIALLDEPQRGLRIAGLEGLARFQGPVPAGAVYRLLRDPDITVQARAVETLSGLRDTSLIRYLIELMQDESEYVRRAAVEVLNEVADQRAIKDLLNALRDRDWWVKVRAADALGTIGGPRVVQAVLSLLRDPDEFLRRTAVEILNTSQDERAYDHLVEALHDPDWWVRERAADALGKLGDRRAVPHLQALSREGPQAARVAVRALTAIGDPRAIPTLIDFLQDAPEVQKEALAGLGSLADETHASEIETAVSALLDSADPAVQELAHDSLRSLIRRFGDLRATPRATAGSGGDTRTLPRSGAATAAPRAGPGAATPARNPGDAGALEPGSLIDGRYRVVRKIGSGGFGVVVLVRDQVVNEELVLKFLHPGVAADEVMVQRFIKELTVTRRITHPNVIRIYDFLTLGDVYAISMEYYPSHSLARELRARKPLAVGRGLGILRQVCRGMRAAQAQKVVHRDLKPANILINQRGLVKIVDFGVAAAARAEATRLTRSGIMIGTPKYMAPEQIRGGAIDCRTDIYTLGIVMYEMFTGRAPYKGEDSMGTLFKHLEAKATPPHELNPSLPRPLEDVILKAMALKPEERFQDFSQFLGALESLDAEAG